MKNIRVISFLDRQWFSVDDFRECLNDDAAVEEAAQVGLNPKDIEIVPACRI